MARQQPGTKRFDVDGDRPVGRPAGEPHPRDESIPGIVRQLADDVAALVRSEVELAKAELRATTRQVTTNVLKIAVAAGLAAAGGMALTAFLVLGLGTLMGGVYWASALIVGVLYLAIGGVLVARAVKNLSPDQLKPDETMESLREDRELAKREAKQLKRDIQA